MARQEMVPAGFLRDAQKRLGGTFVDLAEKLGVSPRQLYNWLNHGKAPLAIRTAVNGLMAELHQANGRGRGKTPPPIPLVMIAAAVPAESAGSIIHFLHSQGIADVRCSAIPEA